MNQLKKLFAVAALTACVLPVAAQYPVIPDSVKIRGEQQQKEIDRKSDEAWAKALPVVMSEAAQGRPYKPWASKPEDLIKSNIPAFPGAEGGGAYTPGGRGGKVIVVNSLADSGPGTLREACETGGARIVVFNVSGVIRLKTPINVRAPYITIAGQTAPGDGVCVTGASCLIRMILLSAICVSVGGRRMCSSGMMLWEVTVWVMLLSIIAPAAGGWMRICLFIAMYTIVIPQDMV